MDILLSGEPQLLEAITALRAEGFACEPLALTNLYGDWLWIADGAPESAAAIAEVLLRVDPEAKTI